MIKNARGASLLNDTSRLNETSCIIQAISKLLVLCLNIVATL